ncbi:hypothetical protein QZH41_017382 [Actinostola sp. cb2023]|nr:hypothetical protein QZH41_017382 [Actinostola sp. cb2023]
MGDRGEIGQVKNAQENGAVGVILYGKDLPQEPNCYGKECETLLSIPACTIHGQPGYSLSECVVGHTYVRFQTTPSHTFTFGIDGQGRVQKTDWFLYPSIRFAAYHAQWFNYVTDFIKNTTGEAKVISIFKDCLLSTVDGTSTVVTLPPYKELLLFQNVEVEMSLLCPRSGSGACTHWDHVIRLFVSCESNKKPGYELVRWIAAYERRATSWITPINSILPLLKTNTTDKCSFHLVTEGLVMPWVVTVNLRLSNKLQSKVFTSPALSGISLEFQIEFLEHFQVTSYHSWFQYRISLPRNTVFLQGVSL